MSEKYSYLEHEELKKPEEEGRFNPTTASDRKYNDLKGMLKTFTRNPLPGSGLDCLTCSTFTRKKYSYLEHEELQKPDEEVRFNPKRILRTVPRKRRPESGCDFLICATFARRRYSCLEHEELQKPEEEGRFKPTPSPSILLFLVFDSQPYTSHPEP